MLMTSLSPPVSPLLYLLLALPAASRIPSAVVGATSNFCMWRLSRVLSPLNFSTSSQPPYGQPVSLYSVRIGLPRVVQSA